MLNPIDIKKLFIISNLTKASVEVSVELVESIAICDAAGMSYQQARHRLEEQYQNILPTDSPINVTEAAKEYVPIWIAIYRPTSSAYSLDLDAKFICYTYWEKPDDIARFVESFVSGYPFEEDTDCM